MRVLITSAGRRVSLLENFRRAAIALDAASESAVYAADLDPSRSAACQVADGHAAVPRADDPQYIERLVELCSDWRIDVLVPTIDTELIPLADARQRFAERGVAVAVSSANLCRTFHSKLATGAFFEHHGIPSPAIIEDVAHAEFPVFAKLDDSSRSIGAGRVADLAGAIALRAKNPRYVFQELVEGDEYTVDAFIDRNGAVVGIVPRKRLEVRDGEVSKGMAVKDPSIISAVRELCHRAQGAYGVLTIQLFKQMDGSLTFIEVNPRFGGGYPLTMHAGADYASHLVRDVRGESLSYDESWSDGTLMLRFDAEVIVRGRGV